ncbi:MAG: nucleotidyltransferase domain-containing protein [Lewinellaceae bacterium]|nr:nucleotidyltransferase domain-containing protein [Lewinellaceae bacterium]
MKIIEHNIKELTNILVIHKVEELSAFGSLVNDNFNEESDLDFVVSFTEMIEEEFASDFFSLEDELQRLFARDVDLCIYEDIIGSQFWEGIKNDLVQIYQNPKK